MMNRKGEKGTTGEKKAKHSTSLFRALVVVVEKEAEKEKRMVCVMVEASHNKKTLKRKWMSFSKQRGETGKGR